MSDLGDFKQVTLALKNKVSANGSLHLNHHDTKLLISFLDKIFEVIKNQEYLLGVIKDNLELTMKENTNTESCE